MRCKRMILLTLSAAGLVALLTPAAGMSIVKLKRLTTISGGPADVAGMARTPDGSLHVIYQTFASVGRAFAGLGTIKITPTGHAGTPVEALPVWQTSQAGLVTMPNGSLAAFFSATNPVSLQSGLWGIGSSDGGATWSAPVNVGAGEFISGDPTAAMSGSTPVITLSGLGIQDGLGPSAHTYNVATPADTDAGNVTEAVDAATNEVVDSWTSIAQNPIRTWMQGVAPTVGTAQAMPGKEHDPLVIAGRDVGPGVFAPYTSDDSHVRLLRYGGTSVAVGKAVGITATNLAAATGLGGRIWVIWGSANAADLAVTRSNKAVTRFEPIQHVNADAFSQWRIFGDGRLGPLDLFSVEIQNKAGVTPGLYYGRVLPVLSASVSVKKVKNGKGKVVAFKLTVKVTDAGDAVAGAKVTTKGKTATTNASGVAKLTLPGSTSSPVQVKVTDGGYQVLTEKVSL